MPRRESVADLRGRQAAGSWHHPCALCIMPAQSARAVKQRQTPIQMPVPPHPPLDVHFGRSREFQSRGAPL